MATLERVPAVLERRLATAVGSSTMSKLSKIARWIGIVGGVGAAVWAARDRFISLTLPREPEPPRFRSTPDSSESDSAVDRRDDLTEIAGIGPVFAERLANRSIVSWKSLAEQAPAEVAEITGASESRAAGWIAEAAHRVL